LVHRGFTHAVIVSGVVEERSKQATGQKEAHKPWTLKEFWGKTVWDWLQLLIVPLVLAAFGFWFAARQEARQQEIEERRAQDLSLEA
jgi:hypothetical protein